jgi:transposase
MFGLTPETRVFIKTGATDGRFGIEALVGLVTRVIHQEVKDGYLFCFANKARTRIKLLWTEGEAFWMATKRVEEKPFDFPRDGAAVKAMTFKQLEAILSGVRFVRLPDGTRRPHSSKRDSNGGYRR